MRRWLLRLVALAGLAVFYTLMVASVAQAAALGASTGLPDITDDLASWASLVGIALPPLVAFLQRGHWPPWVNTLVFGIAVVVASVVYGFVRFGHDFTWAHWEGALLAIVVWGVATYHGIWKQGGDRSVVGKLRAIPSRSEPVAPPPALAKNKPRAKPRPKGR